jgi:tetratricopeptide (TPR) repeat protein
MRQIAMLAALLTAAPCLADPHYVLMRDATNVPPEVLELTIRADRLFTLDQTPKSIELQQEAVRVHRGLVGNDSPDLIATLAGLLDPQSELRQYDRAMETCREILRLALLNFPKDDYRVRAAEVTVRHFERRSTLSDDDQQAIAIAHQDLSEGVSLGTTSSEKRPHLERASATYRRCLGPASCEARMSRLHLCNALVGLREFDKAIAVIVDDLGTMRAEFGGEHPFYAEELAMLCMAYNLNGQDDLAIQHGVVAVKIFQATDCTLVDTAQLMQSALIISYTRQKQYDEAATIAASVVQDIESHPPVDSEQLGTALLAWATVYVAQEAHEKAIPILERLVALRRDDESGKAIELAVAERLLATSHLHLGRFTDAEPLLRHAVTIHRNQTQQDGKRTKLTLCQQQLGECLVGQKRWEEAIPPLENAHRVYHASLGATSPRTRKVRDELAAALRAVGREADANRLTAEPRPFPPVAELRNKDH